jgi:predicted membrane protein
MIGYMGAFHVLLAFLRMLMLILFLVLYCYTAILLYYLTMFIMTRCMIYDSKHNVRALPISVSSSPASTPARTVLDWQTITETRHD